MMFYSKLSLSFLSPWSRFWEFWANRLESRLQLNHVPVHETHSVKVEKIAMTSKTPPLSRIEPLSLVHSLLVNPSQNIVQASYRQLVSEETMYQREREKEKERERERKAAALSSNSIPSTKYPLRIVLLRSSVNKHQCILVRNPLS